MAPNFPSISLHDNLLTSYGDVLARPKGELQFEETWRSDGTTRISYERRRGVALRRTSGERRTTGAARRSNERWSWMLQRGGAACSCFDDEGAARRGVRLPVEESDGEWRRTSAETDEKRKEKNGEYSGGAKNKKALAFLRIVTVRFDFP
ncbi:hypothetical protein SDJN03_08213, partial [Cucurbita argyrosperma subsp. sororia]